MARLSAFGVALRKTPRWAKWKPHRSFTTSPTQDLIEEETLSHYNPDEFYPVHIGDVYNDRYQVTGKLGYGTYSTTWLCRDLQDEKYAALKVSTCIPTHPEVTQREYKAYEHLTTVHSNHTGSDFIRSLWDTFELKGKFGEHQCLVHEPMHGAIAEAQGTPRLDFTKWVLRAVIQALDFLHTEANIIHLDLKPNNIMLRLEDSTVLDAFAEAEKADPSPRKKIDETRTIYKSRRLRSPSKLGSPVLCDLGEARVSKSHDTSFNQPCILRAPELILAMQWDRAVDIWNLGTLTWAILQGTHLFDDKQNYDPFRHIALMTAFLGPPPLDFVRRSENTEQCFDQSSGAWIAHVHALVPDVSLKSLEEQLSGPEQAAFLAFLRSMLQWLPEKRKTAAQLLEDPWLEGITRVQSES